MKLSKCKKILEEYSVALLTGSAVLLTLVAVASTVHHFITLMSALFLVAVAAYFIWKRV